jgi:putative transcriptional regulator
VSVTYTKLWKLLLDKKMKRTDLKSIAGISSSTLAKLGKDEYVSLESIEKICCALDCNIDQIVDVIDHAQDEDSDGKC